MTVLQLVLADKQYSRLVEMAVVNELTVEELLVAFVRDLTFSSGRGGYSAEHAFLWYSSFRIR